MFCRNCGVEIKEGNFCSNCGTKIEFDSIEEKEIHDVEEAVEVEILEAKETLLEESTETTEDIHERRKQKAYSVLAKVGLGLGIGTFASSFMIPGMLFLGIGAFILCSFGRKSKTAFGKARLGRRLSLAGLIVNTAITILLI